VSRASGDRARRGNHGRALLPGHWAPPTGPCWRGGLLASSRPARSAAVVLPPATHCPAICPTGRRVPCRRPCAAEDRAIRHATWRELCCRSRAIAQHNIDCGDKDGQHNNRLAEAPGKLVASRQRLVGPFPPHSGRPRSLARTSKLSTWSQPGCRLPQLCESAAKVPRRYRRLTGRGA
jgi:hypothetical protein